MYSCRLCDGFFDAGELIGGICTDCIEDEREREERRDWTVKMLARSIVEQNDGQLVMRCGTD